MTTLAHPTPHAVTGRRPSSASLLADQVGYALRELWRSRIVLVFTFVLPLVWLVLIGILAGNEAVDEATGVRVMQFVTPTAAVMGVLFASFPTLANSLALAREQKVTKRLLGTPLPTWAYLLGRVGAAVVLATAAVALMLAIGVVAYQVQVQWRSALATLATLVLGVGCLAALGLAVGSLAPSASVAQSFAMAVAVILSFLSGLFTAGAPLPDWMTAFAGVFPVRVLLTSLRDQFNPFLPGTGWDFGGLGMLAGWGTAGVILATWALRHPLRATATTPMVRRERHGTVDMRSSSSGRTSRMAVLADQIRWASLTAGRDAGWVFFAVVMPAGLFALYASMYGEGGPTGPGGVPFTPFFACSMTAYGAGVTAFISMPEAIAKARDRGVLKRLRGTPLSPWEYIAGRTASTLWIALVTAVLVFAAAILLFGVHVTADGVLVGLAVLAIGTLTLAACGYALAAVAPSSGAMAVVGLAILLPLSFFSDVFIVAGAPDWMGTIGSLFPLRHFVHALASAVNPAGASLALTDVAVMALWFVGASIVALRFFRWEPTS